MAGNGPFFNTTQTDNSSFVSTSKKFQHEGGSPGLVVMGGDSRTKGRGFKSQRRILNGHDIFTH